MLGNSSVTVEKLANALGDRLEALQLGDGKRGQKNTVTVGRGGLTGQTERPAGVDKGQAVCQASPRGLAQVVVMENAGRACESV